MMRFRLLSLVSISRKVGGFKGAGGWREVCVVCEKKRPNIFMEVLDVLACACAGSG